MSKKVRRTRKPAPVRGTSSEKFVEPPQKPADDFQVEYAYVLKDLRTVFIIAGFMFILLIALNLFLQ
jgi:hypothetical protein